METINAKESIRCMTTVETHKIKDLIEQYNYLLDKKAEFEHSLKVLKDNTGMSHNIEPVRVLEVELNRTKQELDKLLETTIIIQH